jgi:hypothetical protein
MSEGHSRSESLVRILIHHLQNDSLAYRLDISSSRILERFETASNQPVSSGILVVEDAYR